MAISYLRRSGGNRLLDVGCSSGVFLTRMRDLGWKVQGVDPDPVAAARAEARGISVFVGELRAAGFSAGAFDAITLNHVIEHALDPVGLLRECWRILAPGGQLVVITPNTQSLASRIWGRHWYHLDPPRHLFLFSRRAILLCAARADVPAQVHHTSSRFGWLTWVNSRSIASTGAASLNASPSWLTTLQGAAFQLAEECALVADSDAGEELLCTAIRD
jgi:SAM-dependent methyltransferase